MKRKINLLMMALVSFTFLLTACNDNKDDDAPEPEDNTVEVSLKTKNNVTVDHWVYFSFETNSEVSGIDSSTFQVSKDWDIAFHSRHVRLNGGASGTKGLEAQDMGVISWDSVVKAPESGYIKDVFMDSILFAGVGDYGPIMIGTFLNPAFETAFTYDMSTFPPTYTANKNVYVIKMADNKYVKIMLTDYYNDMGESGYISFQYKFSKDGTGDF